jgi:hypothetical protein
MQAASIARSFDTRTPLFADRFRMKHRVIGFIGSHGQDWIPYICWGRDVTDTSNRVGDGGHVHRGDCVVVSIHTPTKRKLGRKLIEDSDRKTCNPPPVRIYQRFYEGRW